MTTLTIKDLSKQELKNLLLGRFTAQSSSSIELKKRMAEALGEAYQENAVSLEIELMKAVAEWTAYGMAGRLMKGDISVPLLTAEDLSLCGGEIFAFFQASGAVPEIIESENEKEAKAFFEAVLPRAFADVAQLMSDTAGSRTPYEECTLWVNTVLQIASEKDIPLATVLTHQEVKDEIDRRMYSQEEALTSDLKKLDQMLDPNFLKQKTLQPFLNAMREKLKEMMGDDDIVEAMIQEAEGEYDKTVSGQIAERLEKIGPVLRAFVKEENERVYGHPMLLGVSRAQHE